MKQKPNKKKMLNEKVLIGCLLFSIILVSSISLTIGAWFWSEKLDTYRSTAFSYTGAAAAYIDGDRIADYQTTKEKDAYYEQVLQYLQATQRESSLRYLFVCVPCEDKLIYIWDADTSENAYPLGYEEDVSDWDNPIPAIYRQDPPEELIIEVDDELGYIASVYTPIFNSEQEPVAVVGADFSMSGIRSAFIRFILVILLFVAIITLLSVWFFSGFLKKKVVRPIILLEQAAHQMVDHLENEETVWPTFHTGDEIESLTTSLIKMDHEVRDHIKQLAVVTTEKERIGAELDIAAKIQTAMLPCIFPFFSSQKEFEICASMDPAKEVGGDFYDFFMVDPDHLAFVVADVSGKGVPAALYMVIGKTLIKDHTGFHNDLGQVFTEVNDILCTSNSEEMFITAFEGVLNLKTGELRYVNAGHEIPYLCQNGSTYKPFKVKAGFVLAGMAGMTYTGGSIQLHPGDRIFQYTDGIPEAVNTVQQQYGMERLGKVLADHSDCSPSQLLPIIKADVDAFAGAAPQFDDITMLCLRYDGPASE